MAIKKYHVTLICGGSSVEHEVSLRSAQYLLGTLSPERYVPSVIVVTHDGRWLLLHDVARFLREGDQYSFSEGGYDAVMPAIGDKSATWRSLDGLKQWVSDIVFPIIHGTSGEDGALQGLLHWLDVPFVGADILSSALCMDKLMMKALFQSHHIPIAQWIGYDVSDKEHIDTRLIVESLGLPLFVKPADLGSSVGISKVNTEADILPAIREAFRFSRRIILEQAIVGRELEISVIGNREPKASAVGEIKPRLEFYSYSAKYEDPMGAELLVPADLSEVHQKTIQALALTVYRLLNCEGLARVDFFLSQAGEVLVNEINTLPGFTAISMYPKLWQCSGLDSCEMMDIFIASARERFHEKKQLCCRYEEIVPTRGG